MNTLTPQELGLYIGQEIKVEALNGEHTMGTLSQINTYGSIEILCDKYYASIWAIGKCKVVQLLLRPLSSITEEEARGMGYGGIKAFMDATISLKLGVIVSPSEFQYLLSKGFDLFGFIEQGKAIDKTKLK